jgi:hypothetical protein
MERYRNCFENSIVLNRTTVERATNDHFSVLYWMDSAVLSFLADFGDNCCARDNEWIRILDAGQLPKKAIIAYIC